jgi:hypothetical protein
VRNGRLQPGCTMGMPRGSEHKRLQRHEMGLQHCNMHLNVPSRFAADRATAAAAASPATLTAAAAAAPAAICAKRLLWVLVASARHRLCENREQLLFDLTPQHYHSPCEGHTFDCLLAGGWLCGWYRAASACVVLFRVYSIQRLSHVCRVCGRLLPESR